MRLLFLLGLFTIHSQLIFAKSDTTKISVWGTEPEWTLEISGKIGVWKADAGYKPAKLNLTQIDIANNPGFTNEGVNVFVFDSKLGSVTLTLVADKECRCGYDMAEGGSFVQAYLLIPDTSKKTKWKFNNFLGCAKIEGINYK